MTLREARERLLAHRVNRSNDADPWLQGRIQEIARDLEGAMEKAGEALATLGFTIDEAGEFIEDSVTTAEWSAYFDPEFADTAECRCASGLHTCGRPNDE